LVGAIIAIALAVAGGNLAVTTSPARPRVGQRVYVYLTGQVGKTGRLYVFRNLHHSCGATERAERHLGTRLAVHDVNAAFDYTVVYRPRVARREWVCSYLYGESCDAAGQNCGIATGLPPDAGFSQNRVRVRPSSQSANSAAASGRVIT
jgi:hypothetical protein